jgi:hypothetical protein
VKIKRRAGRGGGRPNGFAKASGTEQKQQVRNVDPAAVAPRRAVAAGERKAAGEVPATAGIVTAAPPGALIQFGSKARLGSKGHEGPATLAATLRWCHDHPQYERRSKEYGSPE